MINFSGYLGYIVLGYYLSIINVKGKIIPLLLITIGTSITILGTYFLTVQKNQYSSYFFGYLTPNVMISSIGVFLLFKNIEIKKTKVKKIISFLSNHSFGIYLVHILILEILSMIGIDWKFQNAIYSIPLTTVICLIVSSFIIYLIRKIKYGEYISG